MKLAILLLSFLFIFGINASPFSSEENINFDFSSELSPETYSIIGKIKCKLCKEAMKFVENEINNESAKSEIKKALAKACAIIPEKNLRRKCGEVIERKGDEIVDKIVGNITAENICKVLGFC